MYAWVVMRFCWHAPRRRLAVRPRFQSAARARPHFRMPGHGQDLVVSMVAAGIALTMSLPMFPCVPLHLTGEYISHKLRGGNSSVHFIWTYLVFFGLGLV